MNQTYKRRKTMFKYRIFSTNHDLDIGVADYFDMLKAPEKAVIDPELSVEEWSDDMERQLRQFRGEFDTDAVSSGDPVTIVLDMSGSMTGLSIFGAVLGIEKIGDLLEEAGRPFSVIGFTTSQWRGGLSRKEWREAGRPEYPGRLNDRLHIILKGFDEDWSDVRKYIKLPLIDGVRKENIDGEALQWAYERQIADAGRGHIFHISDGVPADPSTQSENGIRYLDYHLQQVVENITEDGVTYSKLNTSELCAGPVRSWPSRVAKLASDIVQEFSEAVEPQNMPEPG